MSLPLWLLLKGRLRAPCLGSGAEAEGLAGYTGTTTCPQCYAMQPVKDGLFVPHDYLVPTPAQERVSK